MAACDPLVLALAFAAGGGFVRLAARVARAIFAPTESEPRPVDGDGRGDD